MQVTKLENHLYLIDVETAGIKNFIASYVLKGKQTAMVETGPTSSVPNLISALEELDVKPENVAYVAVSHIHLDHGGGVGTLLKYLPNAKVVVHPKGVPHLANPTKLWEQSKEVLGGITDMYGAPEPVSEDRIVAGADGMVFNLGNGVVLKVVETLGHASHHLSYYDTSSDGVFPGDAAGIYLGAIDAVVPTTPSPFRLDIALASLDKLKRLKPKALYYSHFGRAFDAVARLAAYAVQLKLWAKIAKQAIDNGEGFERVKSKIMESDVAVQKAVKLLRVHPVLSETVLNESVLGVMGFVEKYGNVSA